MNEREIIHFSFQNWVKKKALTGIEAWNRYFFSEVALDALNLYRILFCGIVCGEALTWLPYTEELFSTEGYHIPYSFFAAQMTPFEALAFCSLLVICSFMACVGYQTRLSLIITEIVYVFLHSVDSINEKAVETIVIVVLGILIFSPCDSVYSVDVYTGRIAKRERGCVFAQRLLQWEFAQIYFFCGVTKLVVPDWPSGKVFLDSLTGRWASNFGIWVSGWIPDAAVKAAGFGTVIFELFIGFLLLTPTFRVLAVVLSLIFHLGIEVMLEIGSLGKNFMAADLLLFFNPDASAAFIRVARIWCKARWAGLVQGARDFRLAASDETLLNS